ncbi:MAG: PSD1 and planctomycete cytochrome C domain-containing protein [Fuerstiella sp.]|nr:PSD1 and planctomycete cytochrome C domain-containing protein [Fuerstiella sp.]
MKTFCFACILAAGFAVPAGTTSGQDVVELQDRLTFEEDVAPILKSHCFRCHGATKREAGLDLRRRFTLMTGGDSGPTISPGMPQKSLLVELINDGLMPPEEEPQLSQEQADVLRRWIASGAAIAGKDEPPLATDDNIADLVSDEARQHWAFQPVQDVSPPTVENESWVRTPVDAFVLAELQQRQWQPAPVAPRTTLIRRLYFDLTGLPPAPEDVAAFVNDKSVNAYEKVVDHLLASRHYGERWAQHWLDVVRFAETEGFEYDRHLPDAWRFRDYVIDSLNNDKPFNRFVSEQIAGDEIQPDGEQCQSAAIFHRLGAVRRNAGNPDIALSRNEVLTERTNIIGEAFLGLTVGCARCHNHKLEPITQKDYYRLQAYLASTSEYDIPLASPEDHEAWEKRTAEIKADMKKLKAKIVEATGDQAAQLQHELKQLSYDFPPHPATIPSIRNDFENRTAIHVLRRGVWEHKGVAVGARPLSVLVSMSEPELPADVTSPKTRLAQWLTSDRHPLTARVIVNRIWQNHFGTGLVKTANDFGTHGDRPSHPALLDWLASSLVKNNWRLKSVHRLIVLSNTYRQSSQTSDSPETEVSAADPENRFLRHFHRRRLSGEEVRDAMLAVSGRINLKAHGPSVMTPVDPELIGLLYNPSQWRVTSDTREHDRRSIYLIAKRNLRLPFMEAFDAPALQTSCPRRGVSTHAPQALELLNGRFANDMAAAFADRLTHECDGDTVQIVERAYHLAVGRAPTSRERDLSLDFLNEQPLAEFTLAVLNLNEFIYVP